VHKLKNEVPFDKLPEADKKAWMKRYKPELYNELFGGEEKPVSDFYGKMKAERQQQAGSPKYKVLQADMLKQQDKEKAAAVSSFVTSGEEAYKLQGQDGFAYRDLDLRGRCGVVCYKGVEVALLFKREVVEREPFVGEPVPERVLSQPSDAWLQINLINTEAATQQKGIGERLRQALQQGERLNLLWTSEAHNRKRLEEEIARMLKGQLDLKGLRERVPLMEAQLKTQEKETITWKREAQDQKESRKQDKIKMVQELIPAFNTAWLAGEHRLNDPLYDIIRKQMTESLEKIGVFLIDPKVGDKFDPEFHHAIHSYEFDLHSREIGTVRQVNRVGWKLGAQVVEAAEVAVGVERKGEANENVSSESTSV
jgi:molecular chaperone GrpE